MTENTQLSADAGQAFAELRAEVSLMRRAVEGLTAAREKVPDYAPTLAAMTDQMKAVAETVRRIEGSPAGKLTPEALTVEIVKAGAAARAEDARRLDEAREAMARSIGRIDGIVERGQAADQQVRRLVWSCVAGALAGMLVWSILPGAIARSLPESWHVPDWMAARTMRVTREEAGEQIPETRNDTTSRVPQPISRRDD